MLAVAAVGSGPGGDGTGGRADAETGEAEMNTIQDLERRRMAMMGRAGSPRAHGITQAAMPEFRPYRRDIEDQAAIVERVCRWRRSLIAAAMVLELAAEEDR